MNIKEKKIQVYLDVETKSLLVKDAKAKSVSLSRYVSKILEATANNSDNEKMYSARIITLLEKILECVHDKSVFENKIVEQD